MTKQRSVRDADYRSMLALVDAVRSGRAQVVKHDARRKTMTVKRGGTLEVWSLSR